jgi:hypothetical protein
MDAMYRMYVSEKNKHQETRQVLNKAIDLASQLLGEIQKLEAAVNHSHHSPMSRISSQNPLQSLESSSRQQ